MQFALENFFLSSFLKVHRIFSIKMIVAQGIKNYKNTRYLNVNLNKIEIKITRKPFKSERLGHRGHIGFNHA